VRHFQKEQKGFRSFARIKSAGLKGESEGCAYIAEETYLAAGPSEVKGSLCGTEKKKDM